MASVELLRKLIKEEVRAAFKEEVTNLLKEVIMDRKPAQTIKEAVSKPSTPGTLNTKPLRPTPPVLNAGNPLNSLLAETAQSMVADDYTSLSYDTGDVMGFGQLQQRDVPVVSSVNDMMATARVSSNLDAIQINSIPDYTQLMNKLRASGDI